MLTDGIPPDGTPVTVVTTGDMPVIVYHSFLFATSTVFIIVCLMFNIIFRNKKLASIVVKIHVIIIIIRIVKLTSPNLNYVMIIGATALALTGLSFEYYIAQDYTFVATICGVSYWLSKTIE